jgi:hypothetical protein
MANEKISFRSVLAVLSLILVPAINLLCVSLRHVQLAWITTMILLLLFSVLAGQKITGRWQGLLIDERNVISLSRFQMLLWTVLVVSAFITAAFYNVFTNADSPLGIAIPSQVWVALGISTTSLVGTPLILGQKAQKPMTPSEVDKAKGQYDQVANAATPAPAPAPAPVVAVPGAPVSAPSPTPSPSAEVENKGQLVQNKNITDAAWSDMVTGDDFVNGAHLDLSKVQMLFFTIIIISSYAYALWRLFAFAQPDGLTEFPGLDESTIALLGISHSGYLVNKAVPRN